MLISIIYKSYFCKVLNKFIYNNKFFSIIFLVFAQASFRIFRSYIIFIFHVEPLETYVPILTSFLIYGNSCTTPHIEKGKKRKEGEKMRRLSYKNYIPNK